MLFCAIFSLLAITLSTIVQIFRVKAVSKFALSKLHSLSYRLLEFYLRKPYEFHINQNSSELEANVLSETQHVVLQLYRPLANLIASLISIVFTLALLFYIDFLVTLSTVVIFGLFYGVVVFYTKRSLKILGEQRHRQNQMAFKHASEALKGIKDVKVNSLENSYLNKYGKSAKIMSDSMIKAQVLGESPSFLLQGLTFFGMIVLVLILVDLDGLFVVNGVNGVNELIPILGVFAFAGQRIIPELQRVYQGYSQLQYAQKSALVIHHALSELIEEEHNQFQGEISLPNKLDISIQGLSYKFPHAETLALDNINLEIPFGSKVGLIGVSGAGKTTFVDILLGLLKPTSGSVLIGGSSLIHEEMIRWWRTQCCYMPQDTYLTDGTISDNVVYGSCSELNISRVKEAVTNATLGEFTERNGLETRVGEKGVQLSGGQRQRIGLARVFYKNTKIVVLDEATSALDNSTERKVLSNMGQGLGQSTVFLIAHRLSTVRNCDTIVVFNKGKVVGVGSWDDLQESNDYFRELLSSKINKVGNYD
jgi:ABC-type multidrug transport system fused ATPase/permease subunit